MRDIRGIIRLAAFLLAVPCLLRASVTLDDEEVVFRLNAPEAQSVFLVGDFNNWNPTLDALVSRDGPWETRLFLVPGRYRYLFIVDGKRIADPDNPYRDEDGNSFFFFRESNGRYEIAFAPPDRRDPEKEEHLAAGGRYAAAANRDGAVFSAAVGLRGAYDGGLEARAEVAAECRSGRGGEQGGRGFLLHANARRASERTFVEAFHRAGELDFGDPLALFGAVGPFRYPLGLFCRGVAAGATGPFGIRGLVFHASRLEGYRSGLEDKFVSGRGCLSSPSPGAAGGREDTEMIGLSLRGGAGLLEIEYLFRHDRGPGDMGWCAPGDSALVATGYRGFEAHGVVARMRPVGFAAVTVQYLTGQATLTPALRSADEAGAYSFAAPLDWEDGYRLSLGIDLERTARAAGLLWQRTVLDGDPLLREGRSAAVQEIFEARGETVFGPFRTAVRIRSERFTNSGSTGRIFWLQRRNFWLDGDRLRTELLPFLDARGMWEAQLVCEESRKDTLAGPLRSAGYAAAALRRGRDGSDATVVEITAGKGLNLARGVSLHVDIRHVAYRNCLPPGREQFLSAWIALRAGLSGSGWIAIGAGAPPFRFDRWRYEFAGDGREAYLLETGLLDSFERPEGTTLLERLGEAERALSRERRIHFEAGFAF